MAGINWASIQKKIDKCIESPTQAKRIEKLKNEYIQANAGEIASKFCETLRNAAQSSAGSNYKAGELGTAAIAAINNIDMDYGAPVKIGEFYEIPVWFTGDLSRESLMPDNYEGIRNIVAFLNNGRKYTENTVFGVWQGHTTEPIRGLQYRGYSGFIPRAVSDFIGNYGSQYGIVDIKISDEYK